jgi:uncharacterized protein YjeT (DUF2065 family)
MQLLMEKIFGFVFMLVGLSHLLQPTRWSDFFSWLRAKPFGAFIVVIFTLPVSVVIIAFHNDWDLRPSLFLTLAGWIILVKCVIYALYPAAFNRVATKGASNKGFAMAGIAIIVLSAAMLTDIYLL